MQKADLHVLYQHFLLAKVNYFIYYVFVKIRIMVMRVY